MCVCACAYACANDEIMFHVHFLHSCECVSLQNSKPTKWLKLNEKPQPCGNYIFYYIYMYLSYIFHFILYFDSNFFENLFIVTKIEHTFYVYYAIRLVMHFTRAKLNYKFYSILIGLSTGNNEILLMCLCVSVCAYVCVLATSSDPIRQLLNLKFSTGWKVFLLNHANEWQKTNNQPIFDHLKGKMRKFSRERHRDGGGERVGMCNVVKNSLFKWNGVTKYGEINFLLPTGLLNTFFSNISL